MDFLVFGVEVEGLGDTVGVVVRTDLDFQEVVVLLVSLEDLLGLGSFLHDKGGWTRD